MNQKNSKNIDEARKIVLEIIHSFPKSKSWHPFLTLKNGKRIFFRIFLKKYGIDGGVTKYNDSDVIRRVRLVEFLDYLSKHYDTSTQDERIILLRSRFYTMVFKDFWNKKKGSRWELLSLYPHI